MKQPSKATGTVNDALMQLAALVRILEVSPHADATTQGRIEEVRRAIDALIAAAGRMLPEWKFGDSSERYRQEFERELIGDLFSPDEAVRVVTELQP